MRSFLLCMSGLGVIVLLALAALGVAQGATKPDRTKTLLQHLEPGMKVSLVEANGGYEICMFDTGMPPAMHKIISVGPDCVTIQDQVGITEYTIPIYAIKVIKVTRLPK